MRCNYALLFRTNFADLKFDVEEGKKENRTLRTFVFTMKEFVDKYKTEDVYMVHSIQKEMRGVIIIVLFHSNLILYDLLWKPSHVYYDRKQQEKTRK